MNSLWLWLSAAGGDLAPIDTTEVTNRYVRLHRLSEFWYKRAQFMVNYCDHLI